MTPSRAEVPPFRRVVLRGVWTAAAVAVAWLGVACAPRPAANPKQTPVGSGLSAPAETPAVGTGAAPLSATDPCAERLHALCGPLLYYYALNRRLPDRIEDLEQLAGPDPAAGIDCPVSKLPYVYVPKGFALPDKPGFVVLHDAEPSHAGFRWAVVVEEPKGPKQPLITRVVAVPEGQFPRRTPEAEIDPAAEAEGEPAEEPEEAPEE